MRKEGDKLRMFRIIEAQPFYKCNKFMLNLEQVPFNIIEARMQKPRTLGEREHLCHCYACCLVTTAFSAPRTEAGHGESLPLLKKKEERRIPYFTAAFEGDVSLRDPSVSAWTSAQTAADNKLELDAFTVWGIIHKLLCPDLPKKK